MSNALTRIMTKIEHAQNLATSTRLSLREGATVLLALQRARAPLVSWYAVCEGCGQRDRQLAPEGTRKSAKLPGEWTACGRRKRKGGDHFLAFWCPSCQRSPAPPQAPEQKS